MISITIWALILIGVLYWAYRLSRPAKFFVKLKKEEPETYELLHRGSRLPPGAILNGIIANNQYGIIQSARLKKELLDIDSGNAKYAVISMYVFVACILITL